ncbi:MAG: hypothetical protein WCJ19_02520 [bacterium]
MSFSNEERRGLSGGQRRNEVRDIVIFLLSTRFINDSILEKIKKEQLNRIKEEIKHNGGKLPEDETLHDLDFNPKDND